MFDKNDLSNALGQPDEGFNNKFDAALAKAQQAAGEKRPAKWGAARFIKPQPQDGGAGQSMWARLAGTLVATAMLVAIIVVSFSVWNAHNPETLSPGSAPEGDGIYVQEGFTAQEGEEIFPVQEPEVIEDVPDIEEEEPAVYVAPSPRPVQFSPDERVLIDIGASWVITTAPKDFWENQEYHMALEKIVVYDANLPVEELPTVDEEMVKRLRLHLSPPYTFSTKDGKPIELFTLVPGTEVYRADDRGQTLYYNIDNVPAQLCQVYYTVNPNGTVASVGTTGMLEGVYTDATYEEAAAVLEKDFRLPTGLPDGLEPMFHLDSQRGTVSIGYPPSGSNFTLNVEKLRSGEPTAKRYSRTDTVEEFDVGGITVYKAGTGSLDSLNNYGYYWAFGGLAYAMNAFDGALTDEQCVEIIRSMID